MYGPQRPHAAGFEWCFFSTQMQRHFILKLNRTFLPNLPPYTDRKMFNSGI